MEKEAIGRALIEFEAVGSKINVVSGNHPIKSCSDQDISIVSWRIDKEVSSKRQGGIEIRWIYNAGY